MPSSATISSLVRRKPARTSGWPRQFRWLLPLLLLCATALAYLPAWHGQPVWDDDAHLTRPELRSLGGLARIWFEPGATQQYYPVVHSVFWLAQKLWGDAVLPYHLLNIALHAGSALFVVVILRSLRVRGACLAGTIFAFHPVHVESVAWISELKNTLSGVCALSALALYLRFDRSRRWQPYVAALLVFAIGLLSKSVIATLPACLLVIFWWQRGAISWRRDVIPLVPFFVTGIAASLVTIRMERTQIGAEGAEFQFSIAERVLIAGRDFWFYLAKLLWPTRLAFVYPRWQIDAGSWPQYLFPLSVLALVVLSWLARRRSRAPLAAVLIFGGTLFPALGFINVFPFRYSFVADHFQYLASIAIISLGAAAIMKLARRAVCVAAGVIIASLSFMTWRQAHAYTNAETLYRETLALNPTAWMPHNNLANLLMRRGDVDEAIAHYDAALTLRPDYLEARYNLGTALLRRGDVQGAIAQCEAALALNSTSAEAHNNLAAALRQAGQFARAIEHFETAHRLQPRNYSITNNLAWLLATCSDTSLQDHLRALELTQEANRESGGTDPIILHTLSAAYAQSGHLAQARAVAQEALSLAEARREGQIAQMLRREIAQITALLDQSPADATR